MKFKNFLIKKKSFIKKSPEKGVRVKKKEAENGMSVNFFLVS
jgi:hypothetical protein